MTLIEFDIKEWNVLLGVLGFVSGTTCLTVFLYMSRFYERMTEHVLMGLKSNVRANTVKIHKLMKTRDHKQGGEEEEGKEKEGKEKEGEEKEGKEEGKEEKDKERAKEKEKEKTIRSLRIANEAIELFCVEIKFNEPSKVFGILKITYPNIAKMGLIIMTSLFTFLLRMSLETMNIM